MSLRTLPFSLVDVFASEPLSGNGLSVFLLDDELPAAAMQRITQEMRQFETIFLQPLSAIHGLRGTGAPARRHTGDATFAARIFTMEEELSFAGHPLLGAAAVAHTQFFAAKEVIELNFIVRDRRIAVTSRRDGAGNGSTQRGSHGWPKEATSYLTEMDQGPATVGKPIPRAASVALLEALNLRSADVAADLPPQVISTGLAYLIVPISANLDRAKIVVPQFESLLAAIGAKFVYVLDVNRREGRTWDNDGRVEDIATGSAAGPAAAYLVARGLALPDEVITLAQGRFAGRPSELHAIVRSGADPGVSVRGRVCFVGDGALRLPIER